MNNTLYTYNTYYNFAIINLPWSEILINVSKPPEEIYALEM